MPVFMKNSVDGGDMHLCTAEHLRAHFKTITRSQTHSAPLAYFCPVVSDFLTEQHRLANECNICSPETVVDNFIEIGGDVYEGKSVFLTLNVLDNQTPFFAKEHY